MTATIFDPRAAECAAIAKKHRYAAFSCADADPPIEAVLGASGCNPPFDAPVKRSVSQFDLDGAQATMTSLSDKLTFR